MLNDVQRDAVVLVGIVLAITQTILAFSVTIQNVRRQLAALFLFLFCSESVVLIVAFIVYRNGLNWKYYVVWLSAIQILGFVFLAIKVFFFDADQSVGVALVYTLLLTIMLVLDVKYGLRGDGALTRLDVNSYLNVFRAQINPLMFGSLGLNGVCLSGYCVTMIQSLIED
jgi:hypothetical protein